MKKRIFLYGTVFVLITIVSMFTTCEGLGLQDDDVDFTVGAVTTLTADTDADGAITSANREQWFKFNATASTQYLTITFGTLTNLYVRIYNRDGARVEDQNLSKPQPPYTGTYFSTTVTKGNTYWIKVTPYSSSGSGTYQIRFSASELSPESRRNATTLTDTWINDTISDSGRTYKFTATARTQYIHFNFGTLTDLYVRLFDNDGIRLGEDEDDMHLSGSENSNAWVSYTVTSGRVYYIRVFCDNDHSGTYRITSNTRPLPPGTLEVANELTAGIWTNGDISSSTGHNWYKFTATASTQYIHINFGTLTQLSVRLYDSTGNTLGDWIGLNGSKKFTSLLVSSGATYYIRVAPPNGNYGGNYHIAFNTSNEAPN